MSQKTEIFKNISDLANTLKDSELQQQAENITRLITRINQYKISETFKDMQEHDIDLLNQRQREQEYRISALESKLGIQDSTEIETLVKQIFLGMPAIESVYSRPTPSGFVLITVYSAKTISDAIDQIQPGLAKLEDRFPDTSFEPQIIHSTDIHQEHLQQSKIIFKR